MSDIETVLSALPRIQFACRVTLVRDSVSGRLLTEGQARILSQLHSTDPTMVTELAEYMGVTASTMSLNLKRLLEAGFISRERDPEDRRVMNVLLTESGSRIREALRVLDPGRVEAMLNSLSGEERRLVVRGLALLADAADGLVAQGSDYIRSLTEGTEGL